MRNLCTDVRKGNTIELGSVPFIKYEEILKGCALLVCFLVNELYLLFRFNLIKLSAGSLHKILLEVHILASNNYKEAPNEVAIFLQCTDLPSDDASTILHDRVKCSA